MTTGFNVGRDGEAIILHPYAPSGGRMDLTQMTGFHQKPSYDVVTSFTLKGRMLTRPIPKGWTGEFDIDRASEEVDLFCTALEEAAFNGLPYVYGTLTVRVIELTGSFSTYLFQEAAFWVMDAGSFVGDQVVKQKVNFAAPQRRRV